MRTNYAPNPAKITVIGLGGGGCNAVARMVADGIPGVDFVAANTDAQALDLLEVPIKVRLGEELTKGLGVGGDPELGRQAAEEAREKLGTFVEGADMVFITAGMGGGTGTGAAPIVAEQAKEAGALTIAVMTKPFGFEGAKRTEVANTGIAHLMKKVDTLVVIPNDRLFSISGEKTRAQDAFKTADAVLQYGVQGIAGLITTPGMINVDFADVKSVMKEAGPAWMSIGWGSGQNRAADAAKSALDSPLLEVSIDGAKGILFNLVGSDNLTLSEVREAASVISQKADPEANIIFGVVFDPDMEKDVQMTLIATGFADKTNVLSAEDQGYEQVENDLDIPAFLRRSISSQRRQGTTVNNKLHSLRDQFPSL